MSNWKRDTCFLQYSGVCSVLELEKFGERGPTATEGIFGGREDNHPKDLEEFKAHLRRVVTMWDKQYFTPKAWNSKRVERVALIVAYVSSLQPVALQNLQELGFNSTGPLKKLKHPDSELTMFWITPEEFLKNIEYKE